MNAFQLTQQSWNPKEGFGRLIHFELNGKIAYSYNGWHGEYDVSNVLQYKFSEKLKHENVDQPITLDPEAPVVALNFEEALSNGKPAARLTNGTIVNPVFLKYYLNKYPEAVLRHEGGYIPVQIHQHGELVGFIVPLKN